MRITRIHHNQNLDMTTVELEWGDLDNRMLHDFDLSPLGDVRYSGSTNPNGRTGFALLSGPCLLKEGDSINLIPEESEEA